jgi:hypothetical protein
MKTTIRRRAATAAAGLLTVAVLGACGSASDDAKKVGDKTSQGAEDAGTKASNGAKDAGGAIKDGGDKAGDAVGGK